MNLNNNPLYNTVTVFAEKEMYPLPLSLSLDVEFDYVSQEERDEALVYIDNFVKEHDIKPLPIRKLTVLPESCLIYVPADNHIDYADMFDFANQQ